MRTAGLVLAILAAIVLAALYWAGTGGLGHHEEPGKPADSRRSEAFVGATGDAVAVAADALGVPAPKQILFGDLHVHTTFSFDAFLMSLPIVRRRGRAPAGRRLRLRPLLLRARLLVDQRPRRGASRRGTGARPSTPSASATRSRATRPNPIPWPSSAGSGRRSAPRPTNHYGHKNVMLRDIDDAEIPTRPIAAGGLALQAIDDSGARPVARRPAGLARRRSASTTSPRYLAERDELPRCPEGASERGAARPTACEVRRHSGGPLPQARRVGPRLAS